MTKEDIFKPHAAIDFEKELQRKDTLALIGTLTAFCGMLFLGAIFVGAVYGINWIVGL